MKYSTYCAIIGLASASKITAEKKSHMSAEPDVYGKNGANYANTDASEIMAKIGIDITTQGTGDKCKETDWATVHWKGTLTNGAVVTSSHDEGSGLPKQFTVGRSEVFKCWDLAVQQLQTGSKATVSCPAEAVWGGFETTAPLGGDPIPKGSDVVFELEVVHCNDIPYVAPVIKQPHTTSMQPGKCFYFHSDKSEGSEIDLVLATEPYSGDSWRNVIVEQFVRDDPEQQWFYDEEKQSIHNAAYPNLWLENYSGFLGTYTWYDHDNQYWDYDGAKSEFFNDQGNHNMALEAQNNNNVKTNAADDNNKNQKWHIEYCYKNF